MTHIKDLKIGAHIREFRNAWGWTLPELSIRSGISKGLLSKIENDPASNVTINTLIALANTFETEVHELISGGCNNSTGHCICNLRERDSGHRSDCPKQ